LTVLDYRGVIPILPTPFLDDERVDVGSMLRLLDFLASVGIAAVTVLGVLGEAGALTDAEAELLVREVVNANLGLSVIVGASRAGVRSTVSLAEMAAGLGAHAVMVAPPSIDGMPESAVFSYFTGVAAGSPIPIVVQDHPASSRVHMSVPLVVRTIEELEGVCGLKCEAVPTAPKLRAVKAATQRVPVLTGLGALYAGLDLAAGSDGFNTGFAFPEVLLALLDAARHRSRADVMSIYTRFLPLVVIEQQPGPAIRKEIWRLRGLLSTTRVRAPSPQLDEWLAARLVETIADCFGDLDIRGAIKFA
jgi:4-hydroxy-tetrahydrodipicolinate synthase